MKETQSDSMLDLSFIHLACSYYFAIDTYFELKSLLENETVCSMVDQFRLSVFVLP